MDVTDATFEIEVLQKSMTTPVVVDLWAAWCGPCKTLGPIIEKVVAETNGKVILAKVDVDQNPQISQMFQVQSIPSVFALVGGQIADAFTGAKPESEVRDFVQKLMTDHAPTPNAVEALVEAGDEESLRAALELEAGHEVAIIALATILVDRADNEEALTLLSRIPENDDTRHLAARARLAENSGAHADAEARLGELLPLVKTDDEARSEFVDLLEVLGSAHPETAGWRKKLSSALF